MDFNKNFYQPNIEATKEMAEKRLLDLGYKGFSFKSVSRTNGASFYFISKEGEEIRVSDHPITGKRAFNTIQVDLYKKNTLTKDMMPKRKKSKPILLKVGGKMITV